MNINVTRLYFPFAQNKAGDHIVLNTSFPELWLILFLPFIPQSSFCFGNESSVFESQVDSCPGGPCPEALMWLLSPGLWEAQRFSGRQWGTGPAFVPGVKSSHSLHIWAPAQPWKQSGICMSSDLHLMTEGTHSLFVCFNCKISWNTKTKVKIIFLTLSSCFSLTDCF